MIDYQPHLYFAYGSNLNLNQMEWRCPGAIPLRHISLNKWSLVFRGVADVMPNDNAICPGALYRITEEDEMNLDTYEGYNPEGGGLYRKVYFTLRSTDERVMMYVMNREGFARPSERYFDSIQEGYQDWGLNVKHLFSAREAIA